MEKQNVDLFQAPLSAQNYSFKTADSMENFNTASW
jgi:hypothetical protein